MQRFSIFVHMSFIVPWVVQPVILNLLGIIAKLITIFYLTHGIHAPT